MKEPTNDNVVPFCKKKRNASTKKQPIFVKPPSIIINMDTLLRMIVSSPQVLNVVMLYPDHDVTGQFTHDKEGFINGFALSFEDE